MTRPPERPNTPLSAGALSPDAIAERLFAHPEASSAMPIWLDSGSSDAANTPHRLSAKPERVWRLNVNALPPRGLGPWLRERLPPRGGDGALYVLLLAYDAGRNLEDIEESARIDPSLPDVVLARYAAWYESRADDDTLVMKGDPEAGEELHAWLQSACPQPQIPISALALNSSMTQAEHTHALRRVLQGISEGALYQANIARRLSAPFLPLQMPTLYARLRRRNPAPYGALWCLDEDLWLASNSPECLFTWREEDGEVHSYPIKGTRPRGASSEEDEALRLALHADLKERAEHVMIVDLVRNDLGRIARPGSVVVDDLFKVSTWPTLHHMVSDVHAIARAEVDLVDVILALFPGGSITGAPKIAAMQCIEQVEGLRRGFYCGSLGAIGPGGDASFNILIRTCVHAEGTLYYQSGGGIVADSDPDTEWRETEIKAQALLDALTQPR